MQKAPTNNKQIESFVGIANFYGGVIPDFATKMLPLNNMKKKRFLMGQNATKSL